MVYLPHWPIPSTLGNKKIDFETVFERMDKVLAKLNNPHFKLPPIIHVSGTNGKGSTCSIIAKIFSMAGYKTHLYTSPHLFECNERIVLNGQKIDDQFLYQVMEETRIASIGETLSFMEGFTIGAFLAFSQTPGDVLVMECGMGGRIDSTNIAENKIACVITPISLDHTEYLGDNIKKIALEKSMIIKPDVPLIVSDQENDALEIIKIIADDQKAIPWYFNENFAIVSDKKNDSVEYYFEDQKKILIKNPSLIGDHQFINISTAITTCLAINKLYHEYFQINDSAIIDGIQNTKWPSRLEKVQFNSNRIFKNNNIEIWIDGAHNEGGALVLSQWINQHRDHKKNFIICGFSRGKCKEEFIEKFLNIANIIAVRVNGEPYPEETEVICKIAKKFDPNCKGFNDLFSCFKYLDEILNDSLARVVICGSLHLARDLKSLENLLENM